MLLLAIVLLVFYFIWRPQQEQAVQIPEQTMGCVPAEADEIAAIQEADMAKLPIPDLGFPPEFALEMPLVISQGNEGSCCAFACAYAARSFLLHQDHQTSYLTDSGNLDLQVVFSPEFVYNSAKEKSTADCSKAGMKLTQALDLLIKKGVSTWAAMPYSPDNGCSAQPDSMQLDQARFFKIKKTERISKPSENLIKQALFNKYPVIFSANIDRSFMLDGKSVWNKSGSTTLGGHAMVLCGWDDSKHAYKVMNSWGADWGDNGFGWIDYAHFSKVVNGKKGLYEMYIISNGFDSTLLPVIKTTTGYQYSNTLFNGEVIHSGAAPVTQCGICYSTSPHPTVQDENVDGMLQNNVTIVCNPLEDLKNGTTYYVRAYAINHYGIAYGNEIRFYYESESAGILSSPYYPGLLARVK